MESRYNRRYRVVKTQGELEYLRKVIKGLSGTTLYDLGWAEGMREFRYWMDEQERRRKVCYYELESWGHVSEKCTREESGTENVDDRIRWILYGREQGAG